MIIRRYNPFCGTGGPIASKCCHISGVPNATNLIQVFINIGDGEINDLMGACGDAIGKLNHHTCAQILGDLQKLNGTVRTRGLGVLKNIIDGQLHCRSRQPIHTGDKIHVIIWENLD